MRWFPLLALLLVGCGPAGPRLSENWKDSWTGELHLEFAEQREPTLLSGSYAYPQTPAAQLLAYEETALLTGLCSGQDKAIAFTGSGEEGSWVGEVRCGPYRFYSGCDSATLVLTSATAKVSSQKLTLAASGRVDGCGYTREALVSFAGSRP